MNSPMRRIRPTLALLSLAVAPSLFAQDITAPEYAARRAALAGSSLRRANTMPRASMARIRANASKAIAKT